MYIYSVLYTTFIASHFLHLTSTTNANSHPQLDREATDPDPRFDPGPVGPEDPGPEHECPQILYNLLMI